MSQNMEITPFDSYLATVEPKKRSIYKRGFTDFTDKMILSRDFTLMQKRDETSVMESAKPRNIFNPSPSVKAILGWLNHHLLKILPMSRFANAFAIGKTNTEISAMILDAVVVVESPTFVTYDGSSFDATQSAELIKAVDNAILRDLVPSICLRLGFSVV